MLDSEVFLSCHAEPDDAALAGMRVVVMGLGRFGGGIGVTRFLAERGCQVLVTDRADAGTLAESTASLADLPIRYRLGEHLEADLDGADLLVISPAIDVRNHPFVRAAIDRGVCWTTEMNLFLRRCKARIVGLTGTIGKSTSCAMLHQILDHASRELDGLFRSALLGGNIGESLLSRLDSVGSEDVVVLELSSFQLERCASVPFRASVAGLTNLFPHHLDRHDGYPAYRDAKMNLFRHQQAGDTAVLGFVDTETLGQVSEIASVTGARLVHVDAAAPDFDLRVPGAHNQANARMAAAMARAAGVSDPVIARGLESFPGLPHRIAFVAEVDGVRYYNDSKATAVAAIDTALRAFEDPVVLLCGGKDTGAELDALASLDLSPIRAAICFGESGPRLASLLDATPATTLRGTVHSTGTLETAVDAARRMARRGDVVLLSPGCPSYDAFVNYEARGAAFTEKVRGWS